MESRKYNNYRNIVQLNVFMCIWNYKTTINFSVHTKTYLEVNVPIRCNQCVKNLFIFFFISLACAAGKLLLDIVRDNGKYTYPKVTQWRITSNIRICFHNYIISTVEKKSFLYGVIIKNLQGNTYVWCHCATLLRYRQHDCTISIWMWIQKCDRFIK